MNNSIYYLGFNKILSLTKCPKEALLLDKIIFHHQGTLLKRENRLWFTKKIPDLAAELGFSESRIYIYLKNLEENGFIIRKRFKFYGVPRSFIAITEMLQNKLQLINQEPENTLEIKEKIPTPELDINERMDYLVSTDTINKEKNRVINNITLSHSSTKLPLNELNIAKGMLLNVQKQHGVKLSSPQKILDEVVFSLSNQEQFQNIGTFRHKINIISQLLRTNRWRTPKGFNQYSPEGKRYKEECEQENAVRLQLKKEECTYSGLDELATNKRLSNVYELAHPPCTNMELQKSLQIQQSLINGIKKDIKTIKNPNVLDNFLKILAQEETKLSKLQAELSLQ
ncbi:hypothetical protein SDA22_12565 [Legionella pneumophila serogroup 1]|uniref:hypothetical protein n=1 Tax=Legionellaceae TaxID=444 RepID=UPI000770AAF7|nr:MULTISPECIES: hypothetical protein [Legionellaceae]MBN9230392.1 hypothetical protein [Legionella sp.]HAT8858074.1 hypothetical protein [Legionella pneumophila subsp. pneumophila]MCK1848488.1 hypothetical protein [Legionella pneumophila]MCW8393978.1 hypothetical protein [Legionella pneumophila]MCW8462310.1 hypothetical protein [Fluoribacter dumoffii]